jgi:predicted Zn-dependent peptidase
MAMPGTSVKPGRCESAIPPAALPAIALAPEPEQTRERVVRAPKPIATDRLLVGYKAPGQDEADWATLEIVATLLAGCPSARLYRRLVIDREAASSVDAQLTPFRDPSLLRLAVTAARGHTADEILGAIDGELAAMAEQPPQRAEVEKAKAIAETDFWTSLVDVDGKAEAIGHYETALGDFRKVNAIAARLAAVTVEDVARCVRGYLRAERRLLARAWIDEARCQRGINALQAYRREWDEVNKVFKPKALHDWSSHGADALRTFAMGFGDDSAPAGTKRYKQPVKRFGDSTWMSA